MSSALQFVGGVGVNIIPEHLILLNFRKLVVAVCLLWHSSLPMNSLCNHHSLSTTHCADKLLRDGCKQIQIHTDSHWIIDFLRL